jgi:hypothetical protein
MLLWLTICSLLLTEVTSPNAMDGAIPGVVVRTTVSDSERDYELRGATLSPNGGMTELIIAASPKGRRSESESLVWGTVDASGRILSQENPLGKLSPVDSASLTLRGPATGSRFAFVRGGGFLLLATVDGGMRLLRLAHGTELSVVRAVNKSGGSQNVRRVLTTNNEHLVLVGGVGVQPVLTEVDIEGNTIAERLIPEQGLTLINAVFESDGNAVVVGEQGTYPNGTVWVGRVSPRGDILVKTSFLGRPTDFARGTDGTYVVVIEKSGADGSEILMKALRPDLSERWTQSLASRQHLVTSFRVAPIPTGGFILAGTKDRGLWISRVNSDGAEVWTEAHEPRKLPDLEMASYVELASRGDIFVTAYTAFVVAGREQRQVIRVIRFIAN